MSPGHLRARAFSTSGAGLAMPWLTPEASMPPAKNSPTGSALAVSTMSAPGIACVAEAISADGDLVGEGLGEVRLGFSAVAVVVDGDIEIERCDPAAGEAGGAAAFGNAQLQGCVFAFAAGGRNAGRCGSKRAVGLARSEFQDAAGGIDSVRGNLRDGGINVGLRRAQRQPCGERGNGNGSRAVAVGSAVVIDKAGLDDGVADRGMIAARQNMIIAQQVLAAACVLNEGAKGSAAAVDDGVAFFVEVVVIAPGAAEKHGC